MIDALPFGWPTVVHLLDDAVRRSPDATAIVCGDEALVYREYAACVAGLAHELNEAGIGAGSRVVLVMENSIDIAIATFGVQAAGAQVVPLNPAYTASELAPMLVDAAPAGVIHDSAVAATLQPLLTAFRRQLPVASDGPISGESEPAQIKKAGASRSDPTRPAQPVLGIEIGPQARRLTSWRDRPDLADRLPLPDPDSLSTLQYTGGTTGRAKGVDLTHRAVAINVSQREALLPTEPDAERVLAITPLFHVYAVSMGLYLAAACRGTLVVLPRSRPEAVLDAIARHRITLMAASPTIFVGLMASDRFATADLASLRLCYSGASALAEATLQRWERATGCPIVEGYGQSEAGPVLSYNPREGVRKVGTVGVAVPGTQIEIVDARTGCDLLPVGQIGEIRARGPQVMRGYRNRPDETAAALRDGWLYTGDLGELDADGYLTIRGRSKEMAIVGGFNVYPREVEEALCTHPAVREAAVVGVPDAYRGEALVATVAISPADAVSGADLIEYLASRLVRYKVPREIRFVEALPKTTVGKVDKARLRAELAADSS
ncbi:MAG: AMP-binding protein [Caldimonas sp.]